MSGKKKLTYSVKTIEEIDFTEPVVETELVEPEFVIEITPVAETHVVTGKDTWASIAALYCPKGKTVDEYYFELFTLNGKPQLVKGMTLKVA